MGALAIPKERELMWWVFVKLLVYLHGRVKKEQGDAFRPRTGPSPEVQPAQPVDLGCLEGWISCLKQYLQMC